MYICSYRLTSYYIQRTKNNTITEDRIGEGMLYTTYCALLLLGGSHYCGRLVLLQTHCLVVCCDIGSCQVLALTDTEG